MKIITGQRTDRRNQSAFTSKAQRGSEGTRAALEAPEYDPAIPNVRHESCTVLDNLLGQNGTLCPIGGPGWRMQSCCLPGR
jgi:hypothetical protein